MKTVLFILLAFTASAQLEVNETKTDVQAVALIGMNAVLYSVDSGYVLDYQDSEYQHITKREQIVFLDSVELIQFFDLCVKSNEEDTNYETERYSIMNSYKGVVSVGTERGRVFLRVKAIEKAKSKL